MHPEISPDVWSGMWSLQSDVPGGLRTPQKRMWLVLPPQIEQRGACFTIQRRYKLTGTMTEDQLEAARVIYNPVV